MMVHIELLQHFQQHGVEHLALLASTYLLLALVITASCESITASKPRAAPFSHGSHCKHYVTYWYLSTLTLVVLQLVTSTGTTSLALYSITGWTLLGVQSASIIAPILSLIVTHLLVSHSTGSTGDCDILVSRSNRVNLLSVILVRDLAVYSILLALVGIIQCWYSEVFGHPDNWVHGNTLVTPVLIAPEWYLLPFYVVLRCVPSKLYGVVLMCLALTALVPLLGTYHSRFVTRVVSSNYNITPLLRDATLCGVLCLQCNSVDGPIRRSDHMHCSWFTVHNLF